VRILVVETNEVLRSVLRRCLEAEGHRVVVRECKQSGLKAREQGRFDRFICSLQDDTLLVESCTSSGAALLSKPLHIKALLDAVNAPAGKLSLTA
jgi:DNA-binding NarL/FixJ family response regulator